MWTPEHRLAAERSGLRYPSDLTDAEWAIVEPMIPPARHGGRKRSVNVRELLNGIFYILWTGCQWKDSPRGTGGDAHPLVRGQERRRCRLARLEARPWRSVTAAACSTIRTP